MIARIVIRSAYWASIVAGTILAIALVFYGVANTGFGQDWIASAIKPLTGGTVSVSGLRGRFPDSLRAAHVEVSDNKGVWLTADGLTIDWSPFALRNDRAQVARLDANAVSVLRRPVRDASKKDDGSDFTVDIGALKIAKLVTAPEVSGVAGSFTIEGSLHYASDRDANAKLNLQRTDAPGSYRIDASLHDGAVAGDAVIDEAPHGLLAALLDIDDIGPIALTAHASGAKGANAIAVALKAGALEASATGTLDLDATRTNLDFSAHAPAMMPRPGLSWDSVDAKGRLAGSFDTPNVMADIDVRRVAMDGNTIERLTASVGGESGSLDFSGTATGLSIDGLDPKLFARAPVDLKGHAELAGTARTIRATLSHPLVAVEGTYQFASKQAAASITVSNLAPFSAEAGMKLTGRAAISAKADFGDAGTEIAADGQITATGGDESIIPLFGQNIRVAFAGRTGGGSFAISNAQVSGAGTETRVTGTIADGALDLNGAVTLPDVSKLSSSMLGNARLQITARGPLRKPRIQVAGEGDIATEGIAKERVTIALNADGYTKPVSGDFRAGGNFDGAPIATNGVFGWSADGISLNIERGEWKSVRIEGNAKIANAGTGGNLALRIGRLEDVAPFVGQTLSGSADASLDLTNRNGKAVAGIQATLKDFALDPIKAASVTIRGDVLDPTGAPTLALDLDAPAMETAGLRANAKAHIGGPLNALAIRLSSDIADLNGAPASITAAATLGEDAKQIALASFSGRYRGAAFALAAPTRIDLSPNLAVNELRIKSGKGEVTVKGQLSPALNATVSLQTLDAETLRPFLPQLAEGTVAGTAHLTGTLGAPQGAVDMQARGLRLTGVPQGIPRANADMHADLHGGAATINTVIDAGPMTHLTLKGDAPLTAEKAMALNADGKIDLAMVNPVLSAEGRSLRGMGTINIAIGGTFAKPQITGTASIAGGEFQDLVGGVRITGMELAAEGSGMAVRIVKFTGQAGSGTITGSGTVDLNAQGPLVDFALIAKNAKLASNDRLTATLNADLKLHGSLAQRITVSGNAEVLNAVITLPDNLPRQAVVLNVRRSRDPAPVAARAPPLALAANLDVTVNSRGQFYVRGRGLDAEVEGQVHAGGTDSAPLIGGSFTLRRGTLSLAGQTLDFTSGRISFDGASLHGGLDPTLDFQAQSVSGGVTARVAVTGYASSPTIQLSSTPSLPQDEILAHLIFQQSVNQLSPLQLAEVAQAAAALGGFGGGFNPLASIRDNLGLDRLSVGSTTDANGKAVTTVEAGRYVTRRVYVGTKQGVSGGSQAEVQVDIAKNLKIQGSVNTGANANVTQGAAHDQIGTSVGLSYQFEY